MMWTVAMVAGVLLGQVPASAPGRPAAELGGYWGGIAPAAQPAAGTASQVDQVPAPAAGGGFPPQPPAAGSLPVSPAPDGAQPAISAAGQNPPKSGPAADPMSNFGNPLQRIMSITDPKNLGRAGRQGAAGQAKRQAPVPKARAGRPRGPSPHKAATRKASRWRWRSSRRAAPVARQTAGELLQVVLSLPAATGVKGAACRCWMS